MFELRRLWPRDMFPSSFSVSESLSVCGPSVSVPLSPSVADGVDSSTDAVEDIEALRTRSSAFALSEHVDFLGAGGNGMRFASSLRWPYVLSMSRFYGK